MTCTASAGEKMHQFGLLVMSWSGTLYAISRTVVGTVLWFWVVSGAIFALRFLAFVLLDRNAGSATLTAAASMGFGTEQFEKEPSQGSQQ